MTILAAGCFLVVRLFYLDYRHRETTMAKAECFSATYLGLGRILELKDAETGISFQPFVGLVNYTNAVEPCSCALAWDPAYADGYVYRGLAHVLHGDLDAAQADYRMACQLESTLPELQYLADAIEWKSAQLADSHR